MKQSQTPKIQNLVSGNSGIIPAGMVRVEFIFTAAGTAVIAGANFNGTETGDVPATCVYAVEAVGGGTLGPISYSITAGGATLTYF